MTMGVSSAQFGNCVQNIGSPSARVCSTYLEYLSQTSDSIGREGAEDSCYVDLQTMEEYK